MHAELPDSLQDIIESYLFYRGEHKKKIISIGVRECNNNINRYYCEMTIVFFFFFNNKKGK